MEPTKMMNLTEQAFVNACLEHGAEVLLGADTVVVRNPANGEQNTQSRLANTQTFDTPTRAAVAVCENLGLASCGK